MVLELDTPRWRGTRFVLRAGKALRARRKEAVVRFRAASPAASPATCASGSTARATSPCGSPVVADDPDRRLTAASLAGVGPWNADGLDWLAGMGEGNLREFDLVLAGEDALRPALERERDEMLAHAGGASRERWRRT